MMEEYIYYWLSMSQLIHLSHVFEVKRKRQKSEFHANEMTLYLAIQKERKKQQTDNPILSQKNASFHRYFYVIWKLIE